MTLWNYLKKSICMFICKLSIYSKIEAPWGQEPSLSVSPKPAAAAVAKSFQSCPNLCWPYEQQPTRLLCPWDSLGKNTGVGCHFLLQCPQNLSSVQSLSHVRLFATPWTTARQASLSITNSRSSLRLMCIELVMPSSHLILCHPFSSCPQSLPASGSFPMSQLFAWGGQSTGVSASASVLSMNTQDWSPLAWTSWISLQSKGLSRVFSNTTVQKHQFFGVQLSSQFNSHIHTWPLKKP